MNPRDKVAFLKGELNLLYDGLEAGAKGKWGKMNAQQMIEHVADFFNVSTELIKFDLVTPEEHLPKYKEFLLSDKEFRENTKAPASVIGEEPLPLRNPTMEKAIGHLKKSVKNFFAFFEEDPMKKTLHPVFGPLNFEEWVLLHYKHVNHHLRQFHS
jgi:oxepin-CoA hydrolase/3-oxo-5,6-dehydrosuberyl-CoA semialdehyde dehydrogenase